MGGWVVGWGKCKNKANLSPAELPAELELGLSLAIYLHFTVVWKWKQDFSPPSLRVIYQRKKKITVDRGVNVRLIQLHFRIGKQDDRHVSDDYIKFCDLVQIRFFSVQRSLLFGQLKFGLIEGLRGSGPPQDQHFRPVLEFLVFSSHLYTSKGPKKHMTTFKIPTKCV